MIFRQMFFLSFFKWVRYVLFSAWFVFLCFLRVVPGILAKSLTFLFKSIAARENTICLTKDKSKMKERYFLSCSIQGDSEQNKCEKVWH